MGTTSLAATGTSTTVAATTTLPPGTSVYTSATPNTGTLPMEDRWELTVVENATDLGSVTKPRPTSCPPNDDIKYCNREPATIWGAMQYHRDSEWDKCSCGIDWGKIP